MLRCKNKLTSGVLLLHSNIEQQFHRLRDFGRKISIKCISLFQTKINFVCSIKLFPQVFVELTFRIIKTTNLLYPLKHK